MTACATCFATQSSLRLAAWKSSWNCSSRAPILQQVEFDKDVELVIGRENTSSGLRECSLVLTTYKMADRVRGTIGVIGPTRMHYGQVVARVRLVSQATSEVLAHFGN